MKSTVILICNRWVKALRPVIPFAAVAAADFLNLGIMRYTEFVRGIDVYTPDGGEPIGQSRRAGASAVLSCIGSRIFAAAPVLLSTGFTLRWFDNNVHSPRLKMLRLPATLCMLAFAIQFAVPVTFGLFRQSAQMPVSWLEPALQQQILLRAASEGQVELGEATQRIQYVVYNKGL